MTSFELDYLYKELVQIRSHSEVLGVRISAYFRGREDPIQLISTHFNGNMSM